MVSVIILSATAIQACSTKTEIVKPEIELKPFPSLPVIYKSDVMCLTDEAYSKLVESDAKLYNHLRECHAAVEAYNNAE